MNWKLFTAASVSVILSAFPQNIIGCGGSEDPYDYYTSFFSKETTDLTGYRPFYYTSLLTFYSDWENENKEADLPDPVLEEWKKYAGGKVSTADAEQFIYIFNADYIGQLNGHITRKQPATLPADLNKNGMTGYFTSTKDLDALNYLVMAKQAEKYSVASDAWSSPERGDSLELNRYIAGADAQFNKVVNPFLKTKYGFLRCKLAFYNNRFKDCIRWYDEAFAPTDNSAVKEQALAYKAGSLFKTGKAKEAAYAFSQAFALSSKNKRSHFLGFLWASQNANPELKNSYLTLARNNEEKATLLGMFSLFGSSYRLADIAQVHQLSPANPMLEILAIREINKIEEQFLTPRLHSEKGGKAFYFTWEDTKSAFTESNQPLVNTSAFFQKLAADKNTKNPALYLAGAAYIEFINKNYAKADALAASVSKLNPSQKIKEQVQLIRLLVMANDQPKIDAPREEKLLTELQWLRKKAAGQTEYRIFYRNFLSEILAQKYQQQGDIAKAALALGVADLFDLSESEEESYGEGYGIDFVREQMTTTQILTLYGYFDNKTPSPYLKHLLDHSSFNKDKVVDVIGTSYLRDFNFTKAIEWLAKAKNTESLSENYWNSLSQTEENLNVDPFHDYLNDWQRYDKKLSTPYNKLSFAKKMLELETKLPTLKGEEQAKLYYQLASAYYNMSHYGNSYMTVVYYRSSSAWNQGKYDLAWKREYFQVNKARSYYQKAYELSTNKEFKAAAFFLVAKCAQRQIPMPDYNSNDWTAYDKQMAEFNKKFRNNPQFAQFRKEFGATQFYKYAFNRCSYLRDYRP
ncbi:MAG: hypothetical protein SFU20_06875 [Chitinophagaceae bacterium]|nr:hypothetical protein [Chitinophagaceae bacterium]